MKNGSILLSSTFNERKEKYMTSQLSEADLQHTSLLLSAWFYSLVTSGLCKCMLLKLKSGESEATK